MDIIVPLNSTQTFIADSWSEKVRGLMLKSLNDWKNKPFGQTKIREMRAFVLDEIQPTMIQNEDLYLSLSKILNISSQELGSSKLAAYIFDPRLSVSSKIPEEQVKFIHERTLSAAKEALYDFDRAQEDFSAPSLNKK